MAEGNSGGLPVTRAERKRAARVKLVESTAARLFAERGYDGTNFEDIGGELDLRGPSLYYYFPSKEILFSRCMEASSSEVFARLRAVAGTDEPAVDRLHELFRQQAIIALIDFPEFVPLFLKTQISVPALEEQREAIMREHAEIFTSVAMEVADGIDMPRREARVRLMLAFGSLAYLGEWFDPAGELGREKFVRMVANHLTAQFTAVEHQA